MSGQTSPHVPVMLDDVLRALAPAAGQTIIDGTFGAGGYSRAFLEAGASVIGFDRDPAAHGPADMLQAAYRDRFRLVEAPFSTMDAHCEPASIDGVVLDVGVSSMQIDQAERGFSFMQDGPLDMRMASHGPTAADLVNTLGQNDLLRVIGILGEDKAAPRIARAICEARAGEPITTTGQLARIIASVVPRKHSDRIHPATRSFQALRILVNDELRELGAALFAAERLLKPGGKLVVVSFHSLEDRMVKRFVAARSGSAAQSRHLPAAPDQAARFVVDGKPALSASDEEAGRNPRARSARMRVARRTDAPAASPDWSIFKLANLPWVDADRVVNSTRQGDRS